MIIRAKDNGRFEKGICEQIKRLGALHTYKTLYKIAHIKSEEE